MALGNDIWWLERIGSPTCCPLNQWQAFKARWFPGWLKDRFPVLWRVTYCFRMI